MHGSDEENRGSAVFLGRGSALSTEGEASVQVCQFYGGTKNVGKGRNLVDPRTKVVDCQKRTAPRGKYRPLKHVRCGEKKGKDRPMTSLRRLWEGRGSHGPNNSGGPKKTMGKRGFRLLGGGVFNKKIPGVENWDKSEKTVIRKALPTNDHTEKVWGDQRTNALNRGIK